VLRVQRRQCSTCIYRPDSALDIAALEEAIKDPRMEDTSRARERATILATPSAPDSGPGIKTTTTPGNSRSGSY